MNMRNKSFSLLLGMFYVGKFKRSWSKFLILCSTLGLPKIKLIWITGIWVIPNNELISFTFYANFPVENLPTNISLISSHSFTNLVFREDIFAAFSHFPQFVFFLCKTINYLGLKQIFVFRATWKKRKKS